jgi:hypothetical protein
VHPNWEADEHRVGDNPLKLRVGRGSALHGTFIDVMRLIYRLN